MNKQEAIKHIRNRVHKMSDSYTDNFPKWTLGDLAAVSILLSHIKEASQQADSADIIAKRHIATYGRCDKCNAPWTLNHKCR